MRDFSKMKSEGMNCSSKPKKVFIIYASGSEGANERLEIERGYLKSEMKKNLFLCDQKYMQ